MLVVLLLTGLLAQTAAGAQLFAGADLFEPEPIETGGVDGQAFTSVLVGDQLWVGGSFGSARNFGPGQTDLATHNLAVININSGEVMDRSFDLDESGTLDLEIGHPDSVTDGAVFALETDGETIWAGGWFSSVDGTSRQNLAAFDALTGDLRSEFAPALDGTVEDIVLHQGALYIAGGFTNYNGSSLDRLVRVDPVTGAIDESFAPQPSARVWSIAAHGSSIFAAGRFSGDGAEYATSDGSRIRTFGVSTGLAVDVSADGQFVVFGDESNTISGFDRSGSSLWSLRTEGDVISVAVAGDVVYAGFTNGLNAAGDRRKLIELDRATGAIREAFHPLLNTFWAVRSLLVTPQGLVATGDFSKIALEDYENVPGINARRIAVFRPTSPWEPAKPLAATGDVDGSGEVDLTDVRLLLNYLSGTDVGSIDLAAADVSGDSDVTLLDALVLVQQVQPA